MRTVNGRQSEMLDLPFHEAVQDYPDETMLPLNSTPLHMIDHQPTRRGAAIRPSMMAQLPRPRLDLEPSMMVRPRRWLDHQCWVGRLSIRPSHRQDSAVMSSKKLNSYVKSALKGTHNAREPVARAR
jgi:hypothetical protein